MMRQEFVEKKDMFFGMGFIYELDGLCFNISTGETRLSLSPEMAERATDKQYYCLNVFCLPSVSLLERLFSSIKTFVQLLLKELFKTAF
jgi:hypothetical protein